MNSSKRLVTAFLLTNIFCLCVVSATYSQSAGKVFGSITDEFHSRISNAQVTLYSLDRILTVAVDREGHFQFDNVPAGSYELEAVAGGFKTLTRHLEVAGAAASRSVPLDISLRIGNTDGCWNGDAVSYGSANGTVRGRLNGTVVEINDRKLPIANAHVVLFNADVKVSEQQTNERGEFDFNSVAPGRYLIVVTHPLYQELRSSVFWVTRENWTRLTLDPIHVGKIRVCE